MAGLMADCIITDLNDPNPLLDPLVRGDLIEVDWVDICEDPTGDPAAVSLPRRRSIGYFWGRTDDEGLAVLVTTTTLDNDVSGQQGYCAYPEACVVGVKVIKRKRRAKAKEQI